tara:strand:+ start:655 stop:834 length:180 start_codon:yes stop_codon:yes gene_type:complete
MNQYNSITDEQKEAIKDLYFNKGLGQDATARRLGISRNSVKKVINQEPEEVWLRYWGQM